MRVVERGEGEDEMGRRRDGVLPYQAVAHGMSVARGSPGFRRSQVQVT